MPQPPPDDLEKVLAELVEAHNRKREAFHQTVQARKEAELEGDARSDQPREASGAESPPSTHNAFPPTQALLDGVWYDLAAPSTPGTDDAWFYEQAVQYMLRSRATGIRAEIAHLEKSQAKRDPRFQGLIRLYVHRLREAANIFEEPLP
jgi:hypothetical protein